MSFITSPRTLLAVGTIVSLLVSSTLCAETLEEAAARELCEDFLINYLGDAGWEARCLSAMESLPDDRPHEPTAPLPPPRIFPLAATRTAPGPIEGGRDAILNTLEAEESVDIIVEFDVAELRNALATRAYEEGLRALDPAKLAEKRAGYAEIKQAGLAGLSGVTVLRDYENLPTSYVRVSSRDALQAMLARSEVRTVFQNSRYEAFTAESLPLIGQPAAETAGFIGTGVTVAVLDSGVDHTLEPFLCDVPGEVGCQIVESLEAAPQDNSPDDSPFLHGTNVTAIVAATAPDADIVVIDVFTGSGLDLDSFNAAASLLIQQTQTRNIVAANMSFGDPRIFESGLCNGHEFATPVLDILQAGIQPIVVAGNGATTGGPPPVFRDGIASPACVENVVSVGAVYDEDDLGLFLHGCTDDEGLPGDDPADSVVCWSQTSPGLSLLAPGSQVTAGTVSLSGTSQATPHVTGAWAVLSAAVPNATRILEVLQSTGVPITDNRPPTGPRVTPRLNLAPEPGFGTLAICGVLGLLGLERTRRRRAAGCVVSSA